MGWDLIMKTIKRWKKSWIETCTIAGESPFNNGTVECHSLMMVEAMEKTEDEKCKPEKALFWAVSAKSTPQNHS